MVEVPPEQKARVTEALKWAAENKPEHGFHDVPNVGLIHFNDGSEPNWAEMAAREAQEAQMTPDTIALAALSDELEQYAIGLAEHAAHLLKVDAYHGRIGNRRAAAEALRNAAMHLRAVAEVNGTHPAIPYSSDT